MPQTPDRHGNVRKSVLRAVGTTVATLVVMALVLVLGRLAGGFYWVAAAIFCILAYIALVARGATWRQQVARWRSKRGLPPEVHSEPEDER
jgi:hypothetical protein